MKVRGRTWRELEEDPIIFLDVLSVARTLPVQPMLSLSLRQPRLVASFCSTARVLSASRSSSDLTPVTNLLQTAAGDKVGDKGRSEEGMYHSRL